MITPRFDVPDDTVEISLAQLGPAPSPTEGTHPCHARSVTIIDLEGQAPPGPAAAPPSAPAVPARLWRRLLTRR